MGLLDSIKKGSFVASFTTTKELFKYFIDDYVTMKAKAKILKNKESHKKQYELLTNEIATMEKVLEGVKEWCKEATKSIEEVTK